MKPEEVKSGRGNQGTEFFDELHGIEKQMGGTISARLRFIPVKPLRNVTEREEIIEPCTR